MKVKFCGLRTAEDVKRAAEFGCDAVGFVFVTDSKRYVTIEQAIPLIELAQQLGLLTVALVANAEVNEINDIIQYVQPDVIQFHGFEDADFCEQFNHRYWKAIPMLNKPDWQITIKEYKYAEKFLLDNYGDKQSGGSGRAFTWFRFPDSGLNQLILAGGLQAKNINQAIAETGTKYIDISSGIEATPGVKSHAKMQHIMQLVANLK